ncbi:YceI family protein [Pontivivens ytuae]|uniref:YceI family protein n=1 Tax=Pontivivens ytuae TaxID=2789856 RepID=A0A7S9LSC3_9RHOB|nr:YceI family protein [Pontivivens ytuae]QPH54407.1 YceI family protein [Pontivivens ytuae]
MSLRSLALATALTAAPFAAQAWEVDMSHTQVTFEVSHLGFSTMSGRFTEFEPEVSFDPEDIEATEISFVIDAASIDTGWKARDEHLNRSDFLNTGEYPEITFTSTSVTQTGENTADVTGDLTMLGQTQEVTFNATLNALGPFPFNPEMQIAGFTATADVDRTAFGMGFGAPAIPAVIPVTVNIELTNQE